MIPGSESGERTLGWTLEYGKGVDDSPHLQNAGHDRRPTTLVQEVS